MGRVTVQVLLLCLHFLCFKGSFKGICRSCVSLSSFSNSIAYLQKCLKQQLLHTTKLFFTSGSCVSLNQAVVNGVKGLLLVMAVFQFCVSTTISVFSAKAIRQDSADQLVRALLA